MFETIPRYDKYRPLSLQPKIIARMVGEDVFALQNALKTLGFKVGGLDGSLGPITSQAIYGAQEKFDLMVDGIAGGIDSCSN